MSMAKAKETRTEEIKTDAAEQAAPTVETTGDAAPAKADVPPDPSTTTGSASPTVTVYCNLPQGLTFRLPDGRTVTFPVLSDRTDKRCRRAGTARRGMCNGQTGSGFSRRTATPPISGRRIPSFLQPILKRKAQP